MCWAVERKDLHDVIVLFRVAEARDLFAPSGRLQVLKCNASIDCSRPLVPREDQLFMPWLIRLR